jgi:Luciferase-like monooxygenase
VLAGARAPAAAVTTRLHVGTLVLDNDFRHPVIVAHQAASLHQLSGGRFEPGLGAGWYQPEYETAGIPFDPRGSVTQIREDLLAGRERFGLSYLVTSDRALPALTQVIASLSRAPGRTAADRKEKSTRRRTGRSSVLHCSRCLSWPRSAGCSAAWWCPLGRHGPSGSSAEEATWTLAPAAGERHRQVRYDR